MNGRFTEHIFYSISPRLDKKVSGFGFLPKIPQPNHRIQTKAQCRGSFGSWIFVSLRFLTAETLLCVFEGIFDGPSVAETLQNFRSCHTQIGCKQKIVRLFYGWGSAYHKQYRLVRNPVPYYSPGINKSLYCFASLTKFYQLPILNIRSHLLRVGQAFAFLSRSASGFLLSFGRQIEDFCISLYSRNKMSICHLFSRKRSVKAICCHLESSFQTIDLPVRSSAVPIL